MVLHLIEGHENENISTYSGSSQKVQ